MNDMIESAAKALYESIDDNHWDDEAAYNIELFRDEARTMVRSAIAALREPSEEMVSKAWELLQHTKYRPTSGKECWQAMIDALLAETEKTDE